MSVRTIEPNDLRVLLCFAFDHRADPGKIAEFKTSLIKSETVLHSVELSGTFDFICEERLPSLRAYHRRYAELAPHVALLAERFEACFVCKRFVRSERDQVEAFWVSCHDGKRRVAVDQIDAIHAEGDYVRLRCGPESFLHDSTMNAMIAALDGEDFVRLHRSIIVRLDKIDRLIHHDNGWTVRLENGTQERIAKSRVMSVLRAIRESSPTDQGHSSMNDDDGRKLQHSDRELVDANQQYEERSPAGWKKPPVGR
jgi:hypothetical protein